MQRLNSITVTPPGTPVAGQNTQAGNAWLGGRFPTGLLPLLLLTLLQGMAEVKAFQYY